MERRNLDDKLKEYTTRKLREEWAEHEEMFQLDVGEAIKVGCLIITISLRHESESFVNAFYLFVNIF